jgi:hypothetical protein
MKIPRFSAEASLVKTSFQYRSAGTWLHRSGGSAESQVLASYIVHRCPPGTSYRCQWIHIGGYERYWECGCFPNYVVALPPIG